MNPGYPPPGQSPLGHNPPYGILSGGILSRGLCRDTARIRRKRTIAPVDVADVARAPEHPAHRQ